MPGEWRRRNSWRDRWPPSNGGVRAAARELHFQVNCAVDVVPTGTTIGVGRWRASQHEKVNKRWKGSARYVEQRRRHMCEKARQLNF